MLKSLLPNMELANPEMLWLLLLLPLALGLRHLSNKGRKVSLTISTIAPVQKLDIPWKVRLRPLLTILEGICFVFLVLAMSRPQQTSSHQSIHSEGINIVLSLDISGSMLSEDFTPNRVEAAKRIAVDFVKKRPTDRIGLVIFAGESFTQCPITIDHNVLIDQINAVKSGLVQDGTAIGMGLGTAVDRLRHIEGKTKIIILMTDGVNNTGKIDPETALELAKAYNVKVYTIGIGTRGKALYPVQTPTGVQKQMLPVEIDEALLEKIAKETGGAYYRATDNKSLKNIYQTIDQLEKSKIEVDAFTQHEDLFFPLAIIGLFSLLLAFLLRFTYFRTIS